MFKKQELEDYTDYDDPNWRQQIIANEIAQERNRPMINYREIRKNKIINKLEQDKQERKKNNIRFLNKALNINKCMNYDHTNWKLQQTI